MELMQQGMEDTCATQIAQSGLILTLSTLKAKQLFTIKLCFAANCYPLLGE